MNRNIIDNSSCSGCGVCSVVCPTNAISFRDDLKGFLRPVINEECINCGLCLKRCHEHNIYQGNKIIKAFTAYINDLEIRNVSSSGGVFSGIAINIIKQGGFVCAAGFDKNFILRHWIVDREEDLDFLRQSKYLESNVMLVWKQLKERVVVNHQKGMFVGTPCQCAALRTYLGEYADNILICDFICHGVASPMVFEKFKKYLLKNHGYPKKIEFRHKEKGNGSFFYYEGSDSVYMIPNYKKSYPYAYASGLIIANDCTNCKYCSLERYSDITLGDYVSGSTDYSKSTIFTNTQKGVDFLNSCKNIIISEEELEAVVERSWHLTTPNTYNPKRNNVFVDLCKSWEYLEKKYFHQPSIWELYRDALINKIKRYIR